MKAIIQKVNAHSLYARVFAWGKLITITGGSQAIVQATGLLSGILIIRMLTKEEYAIYTLANTMLGMMIILADAGIAYGVMALGGQVWQDKNGLSRVLATGFQLRKQFAVVSLIISMPVLVFLMWRHNAGWVEIVLIVLALVPAFWASLNDSLLQVAPKLRQDIGPLQRNQIEANAARLLLTVISVLIFPFAYVAIFVSGITRVWANKRLEPLSLKYADQTVAPDPDVRKKLLGFVARLLPGSIYVCIASQVTIWLISYFGSTAAVAEIGALGRLTMVLHVFGVMFTTLILPRFARLLPVRTLLLKRYLQVLAGFLVLGVICVGITWLLAPQILWVLGDEYGNLQYELVLSIAGGCMAMVANAAFTLCTNRGWVLNPLVSIPISILSVCVSAAIFDLSSLEGILFLNILVEAVILLMNAVYCIIKIGKMAPVT